MKKLLILCAAALSLALAACGSGSGSGSSLTSEVDGYTLADAQALLTAEGVDPSNVTVEGEREPDAIVCDHDPDGVAPTTPTTLYAAYDCDTAFEEGGVLFAFVKAGKIKKHKVKVKPKGAAKKLIEQAKKRRSSTSGSGTSSGSGSSGSTAPKPAKPKPAKPKK